MNIEEIYNSPFAIGKDFVRNKLNGVGSIKFETRENIEGYLSKLNMLGYKVTSARKEVFQAKIGRNVTFISRRKFVLPENCNGLFYGLHCESLDLSNVGSSFIKRAEAMFSYAKIENLNISGLNLSNVRDLSNLFSNFEGNIIGLDTINTSGCEILMMHHQTFPPCHILY